MTKSERSVFAAALAVFAGAGAVAVACEACEVEPHLRPDDGPTHHARGPVPEGGSRFAAQCQWRDFAATAADGTSVAGQLYVAAVAAQAGDVAAVVLGPVPEQGAETRLAVTGSITAADVALEILLPDTTTLTLTGTADAVVDACSGEMRGDVALAPPDAGKRTDAGAGAAVAPRGKWYARAATQPPATASDCSAHAADPLVCGVFVP